MRLSLWAFWYSQVCAVSGDLLPFVIPVRMDWVVTALEYDCYQQHTSYSKEFVCISIPLSGGMDSLDVKATFIAENGIDSGQ